MSNDVDTTAWPEPEDEVCPECGGSDVFTNCPACHPEPIG